MTITSDQMDVYLVPAGGRHAAPKIAITDAPSSSPVQASAPAQLDKVIASGSVLITQPNRRATGDQLTYTASDDKFVLTVGAPSIFDAEHGMITVRSFTV